MWHCCKTNPFCLLNHSTWAVVFFHGRNPSKFENKLILHCREYILHPNLHRFSSQSRDVGKLISFKSKKEEGRMWSLCRGKHFQDQVTKCGISLEAKTHFIEYCWLQRHHFLWGRETQTNFQLQMSSKDGLVSSNIPNFLVKFFLPSPLLQITKSFRFDWQNEIKASCAFKYYKN